MALRLDVHVLRVIAKELRQPLEEREADLADPSVVLLEMDAVIEDDLLSDDANLVLVGAAVLVRVAVLGFGLVRTEIFFVR